MIGTTASNFSLYSRLFSHRLCCLRTSSIAFSSAETIREVLAGFVIKSITPSDIAFFA